MAMGYDSHPANAISTSVPAVLRIEVETTTGPVPAILEGEGAVGILLATGAGTGQEHPGMAGLRHRLAVAGFTVLTFEYPYRARGARFPDPMPRLQEAHRAAAATLRSRMDGPLVLAGRSMGGRISTMLAAAGEPCAAVVCYGYPLHPGGRPDRLRISHLGDLTVPTLFLSGTRDRLATPELVERHLRPLPIADLVWIENADHSFRRRGTSPGEMLDELVTETVRWLQAIAGLAGDPAPTR